MDLIAKTKNYSTITWLGKPIWQSVLDLWTIQETIAEVRPALLIETGTNRGGSALFYAHLFDLIGSGNVVTVDVEELHELSHPRITFVRGNSVDSDVVDKVSREVHTANGPVMVILDSDHSPNHVAKELEAYSSFVTPGSFILVQDGVIDVLPIFGGTPGPLAAIEQFVQRHPEFTVDDERNGRFLVTHHPKGC